MYGTMPRMEKIWVAGTKKAQNVNAFWVIVHRREVAEAQKEIFNNEIRRLNGLI